MMVEGEAKECSEDDLIKALEIAHDAIRIQIKAQEGTLGTGRCQRQNENTQNRNTMKSLSAKVNAFAKQKVYEISKAALRKHERSDKFDEIKEALIGAIKEGL